MTVILITHRLPEVMRVSDRVGVMRRGRLEKVMETRDTSEREIASLMVGRDVLFGDLPADRRQGRSAWSSVACARWATGAFRRFAAWT